VRRLALTALVIFGVAGRPALAKPAGGGVTRAAVEARLNTFHNDSAAGWQALGPGADLALVEIGGDAKAPALVRARAVSALGYFPTAPARRFLEQTLDGKATATDPTDRLLLRRAAVALGWLGGLGVTARLGPLLAHADPEVRVDAAIGLGLTRLAISADLLRKRLDVEPLPRVRSQIGRQLRVVEEALAAAAAAK
jgi:HEAT repeat protein